MRKMIWVSTAERETWGCAECSWSFHPSGPPLGDSLEEMKKNYEHQRDKEFDAHKCGQQPKTWESGS
jgi:hypothetical protein